MLLRKNRLPYCEFEQLKVLPTMIGLLFLLTASSYSYSQNGLSRFPTFDFASGTLKSERCVLILDDQHPIPYAPGQERYFVEFAFNGTSFSLTKATPGSHFDTCAGTYDSRTREYLTTVYIGNHLHKGPPVVPGRNYKPEFKFLDPAAIEAKVEAKFTLNEESQFVLSEFAYARNYIPEEVLVQAGQQASIQLPEQIDIRLLTVSSKDGFSPVDFAIISSNSLILAPAENDVGFHNLRLKWGNEIEYIHVVVQATDVEPEVDSIDISEFNPVNVAEIPVRVITFNPDSFEGGDGLRVAYTFYAINTTYEDFNSQFGMGLDTDNFEAHCGPLPQRYERSGAAFGATPCMVNTLFDQVNQKFAVYENLGIHFSVKEIVESDFTGFDMTISTNELLGLLSKSELAKNGHINIFYLPYVECCQGTTYLNGDLNAEQGVSILRANQLDLPYNAIITAHEIGHALGVPHLTATSTYSPKPNPGASLQIPSFLDIDALAGCEYLNIMSNFTDGCSGAYVFNTPVHGNIIKKIIARQLYEWGLTTQKVRLN